MSTAPRRVRRPFRPDAVAVPFGRTRAPSRRGSGELAAHLSLTPPRCGPFEANVSRPRTSRAAQCFSLRARLSAASIGVMTAQAISSSRARSTFDRANTSQPPSPAAAATSSEVP